jgi:hypothetical protein
MERWAESVKDYEVLRRELPGDTEVAEAYFHAQVALKSSRGEEVSNLKFGGEVEAITGMDQFQMATSLPGLSYWLVSLIFFFAGSVLVSCISLITHILTDTLYRKNENKK